MAVLILTAPLQVYPVSWSHSSCFNIIFILFFGLIWRTNGQNWLLILGWSWLMPFLYTLLDKTWLVYDMVRSAYALADIQTKYIMAWVFCLFFFFIVYNAGQKKRNSESRIFRVPPEGEGSTLNTVQHTQDNFKTACHFWKRYLPYLLRNPGLSEGISENRNCTFPKILLETVLLGHLLQIVC